jgi:hypothetical protein
LHLNSRLLAIINREKLIVDSAPAL